MICEGVPRTACVNDTIAFFTDITFSAKRRPSDTRALTLAHVHVLVARARECTHTFVRLISGI